MAKEFHSAESEASLLGCLVLENWTIPKVAARLEPEAFFLDPHRTVYTSILEVFRDRKVVDLVLLKERLSEGDLQAIGGLPKLASLVEQVPNTHNWRAYADVVEEKWRWRQSLAAAKEIGELGEAGADLKDVYKVADRIKAAAVVSSTLSLNDVIKRASDDIKSIAEGGVDLRFGLRDVDENVGGLRRGLLYVVGAKTSQGKTSFVTNTAYKNLQGNAKARVLFNVFENIDQVPTRMAAIASGVPFGCFVKPDLFGEEDVKKAQKALQDLGQYNDRMIVLNSASIMQMRAICDEFHPDIVVVDYLQRYAHRYGLAQEGRLSHEVGKVVSDLQDLAIEKRCAVICLSQFSRRTEAERNRRPVLNDLKESGDTENYADVILLGWWPWRDDPSGRKDPQNYNVIIAKKDRKSVV